MSPNTLSPLYKLPKFRAILVSVNESFVFSGFKWVFPFFVIDFPLKRTKKSGFTRTILKFVLKYMHFLRNRNAEICLRIVMLLFPVPWIGNIKTRPFTEYGPSSSRRGPFKRISYFPSILSLNPLKKIIINASVNHILVVENFEFKLETIGKWFEFTQFCKTRSHANQ